MKVKSINYTTGIINDEIMTTLANALNEGFEILKLDVQWVPEGPNHDISYRPCVVAILIKEEPDEPIT